MRPQGWIGWEPRLRLCLGNAVFWNSRVTQTSSLLPPQLLPSMSLIPFAPFKRRERVFLSRSAGPLLRFGTGRFRSLIYDFWLLILIETHSFPSSLAASYRGFAFCLADSIGSAADSRRSPRILFFGTFRRQLARHGRLTTASPSNGHGDQDG